MTAAPELPAPVGHFSNWIALFALIISAGLGVERALDVFFYQDTRNQSLLRTELRQIVKRMTEIDLQINELSTSEDKTTAGTRISLMLPEKITLIERALEVVSDLENGPPAPEAYILSGNAKLHGYESDAIILAEIAVGKAKTDKLRADANSGLAGILILPGPHQDQDRARALYEQAILQTKKANILAPWDVSYKNIYSQWIGWELTHGSCAIAKATLVKAHGDLADDVYGSVKLSEFNSQIRQLAAHHPRCGIRVSP